MVDSIIQLEARFNSRLTHRYDWVFFNDEEFSPEFMWAVANATSSQCFFETINKKHWSVPSWIDPNRFDVSRHFMGSIGVGKAWLQSYRHMCRWNAGLFALEDRLAQYDFFWRVEPGVKFSCNINYDVFRFMRDNDLAYGFNMVILDDARSFPSLWDKTKAFVKSNSELIHPDADFDWLLQKPLNEESMPHGSKQPGNDGSVDDDTEDRLDRLYHMEYNNCQFYSNFEIGSLGFFRSEEHISYFRHLDRAGGFYYERFGDAPIHTISVSLFLPKSRTWYFRDIGYAHGLCEQCPPHKTDLGVEPEQVSAFTTSGSVLDSGSLDPHRRWEAMSHDFIRQRGIPGLACGCTVSAIDNNNAKLVPYESKQKKPEHPCVRLFLGGQWLEKKPDWNHEEEIAAGRDGSGGYLLDGLESNPFLDIDANADARQD
ncbi:glycosyltransferase family 15 protein [Poronia punctata]|nr:glycosyltransferase family 15 protein [Poronia punctata]